MPKMTKEERKRIEEELKKQDEVRAYLNQKNQQGSKFEKFVDKYFAPSAKEDFLDIFSLLKLVIYGNLKLISAVRQKYKEWKKEGRVKDTIKTKAAAITASRNRNIVNATSIDEMTPAVRERAREIAKNMIANKNPAVNGRDFDKLSFDLAKQMQIAENAKNEQNPWIAGWKKNVERELRNEIEKDVKSPNSVQLTQEYMNYVNSDAFLQRQVNARVEQYVQEAVRNDPSMEEKIDDLRNGFFNTAYEQANLDRSVINEQYKWQNDMKVQILNEQAALIDAAERMEQRRDREAAEKQAENKDKPAKADEAAKEEKAAGDKAEEAKAEEARAEEAKAEEAKAEEAKAEEAKAEDAKAEDAKEEEAKADEVKAEENPIYDANAKGNENVSAVQMREWWAGEGGKAALENDLKAPAKGENESVERKEFREAAERFVNAAKDPHKSIDDMENELREFYGKARKFNDFIKDNPNSPEIQKGYGLSLNTVSVMEMGNVANVKDIGNGRGGQNEIKAPENANATLPRWWSGNVLDEFVKNEENYRKEVKTPESKEHLEFMESVKKLAEATNDPKRSTDPLSKEYCEVYDKAAAFTDHLKQNPNSLEHNGYSENFADHMQYILNDNNRIEEYRKLNERDPERVNDIAQRVVENKAPLDRNKAPLEKENLEKNNIMDLDKEKEMMRQRRHSLRKREQNELNKDEAYNIGMV